MSENKSQRRGKYTNRACEECRRQRAKVYLLSHQVHVIIQLARRKPFPVPAALGHPPERTSHRGPSATLMPFRRNSALICRPRSCVRFRFQDAPATLYARGVYVHHIRRTGCRSGCRVDRVPGSRFGVRCRCSRRSRLCSRCGRM